MEKYYRVDDVKKIIKKLAKEPAYQHEEEDYYVGIASVECELSDLEEVVLEAGADLQEVNDRRLHVAQVARTLCSSYGEPGCEKDCTYSDCFAEITAENLYDAGCRIGSAVASDIISNIEQILNCGADDELRITVRLAELRKKYCPEV